MYLVQEHANCGCRMHGEPGVMGIETHVSARPPMPCTECVAQFCKVSPDR